MKTMNKILLMLIVILITAFCLLASDYYTDSVESDNNTLILSVCTSNMRALEIGVSTYAAINANPYILTDTTLPEQLNNWLPSYVKRNNIHDMIIVGPIKAEQALKFKLMGLNIKQVDGTSIAQILTKIADNTNNKNNTTVIFTSSEPIAGYLGGYIKAPVFVTASNASYQSSESLADEYINYLENHPVNHIIIVGSLPQNITNKLKEYADVEVLSGQTSAEVSIAVNNKLKEEGYINNTTVAYYGFYGEVPTVVPLAIKDNAMLIVDSTSNADVIDYLKENNITTIYLTRNMESDYIQMEETDYISSNLIDKFKRKNFKLKYLTRNRTLDEATGLYDMKIISVDDNENKIMDDKNITHITKSPPPLLSILDKDEWVDSNNITVKITKESEDNYTVKWNTIHPYTYIKSGNDSYHITSNTGYDYFWTKNDNMWKVEYRHQNKTYYNITWIENNDNSWDEIQNNITYNWKYDGSNWYCYNDKQLIYTLSTK